MSSLKSPTNHNYIQSTNDIELMIVAAANSVDIALFDELVEWGLWNSLVQRSKVLHSGSVDFQLDDNFQDEPKQLSSFLANTWLTYIGCG